MHKYFFKILILTLTPLFYGCSDDVNNEVYTPIILDNPPRYLNNSNLSIARKWNEVLLDAIRLDYARPTVHARNLFHVSAAMFDAWSLFDDDAHPYLLNSNLTNTPSCSININDLSKQNPQKSISYAAYHLIHHRFKSSVNSEYIYGLADTLMATLNYDVNSANNSLGKQVANCYIQYGLTDGANEANNYQNQHYQSINPPLMLSLPGNPNILNLDRWQSLSFADSFIDQSGNIINSSGAPKFLNPEWGQVKPFSLITDSLTTYQTRDYDYLVYHDPGAPPLSNDDSFAEYQWGFALVAAWSSHLSPNDQVMMDISPASLGNIQQFPSTLSEMQDFYNLKDGGDNSQGYAINPITNIAYESQWVPRGDYARVLAEFWADGPDSETPPGHWFVILNSVSDHPLLEKRLEGRGELLGGLEWDIKAYFTLSGAMHDAAISAWGIKGYYDYIRPISAIRAMSDLGQSTDEKLTNYHPKGIPLIDGYIELVSETDDLAGALSRHAGKIKIKAWAGPEKIQDANTDSAGVNWVLAENWWPYQRPSFVTPPFAGYVSGHSTFSRAAAEVLTALTGNEYFPGGMSEFSITANEFLVFEQGPSIDLTLQWASYRDASDQCSLSRIWGGIHPPADDIPGREIGRTIGIDAFQKALRYFE